MRLSPWGPAHHEMPTLAATRPYYLTCGHSESSRRFYHMVSNRRPTHLVMPCCPVPCMLCGNSPTLHGLSHVSRVGYLNIMQDKLGTCADAHLKARFIAAAVSSDPASVLQSHSPGTELPALEFIVTCRKRAMAMLSRLSSAFH